MVSQITYGTAFAAGVVSFLSPCVLPLVPGYISFISGLSLDELTKNPDRAAVLRRTVVGSLSFTLGFATVFTALGASASVVGQWLFDYQSVLSKIAGVIIFFFGLHTMGVLPIKWLYYEKRFQANKTAPGALGAFVMGLAFAFGWTPCIGPILAAILALAATQDTVAKGTALLFVYSLGLGIPFILTGFGVNTFLRFFARYKRFIRWGEIAAGLLLVAIGLLIFFNRLTLLINYLPESFMRFAR